MVAEDLLHDAYVQFVISRPDLTQIADLDAYLHVLVRNLYISTQRRKANQQPVHVGFEEYDSAERALERAGPYQRLAARESLLRLCTHLCQRKETSRSASVLILRFFHGFYPSEIERVLGAPARSVSRLLAKARAEARVVLAASGRLRPPHGRNGIVVAMPQVASDDPSEILGALRDAIFATSAPPCPESIVLGRSARDAHARVSTSTLAHVVSCRTCLGAVGVALTLSSVDERPPTDPPAGPGAVDATTGASSTALHRARHRGVRDLLEHRPKELQVSINGLRVGLLRVTSAENRVRWTVRVDEPIAFAELHSEQCVRMLLVSLTPPPDGPLVQGARIALTDDRCIALAVDFTEPHPAVTVEYADPSLATIATPRPVRLDADAVATSTPAAGTLLPFLWEQLPLLWRWRARRLGPAGALGLFLLMAGGVWWVRTGGEPAPDASALIARAVSTEARTALVPERVTRRALRFDVRRLDSSTADVIHHLETWTLGGTGQHAVRVLDAAGHVVAGQWTDSTGSTTTIGLGEWDDVWQGGLSATVFRNRYMTIGPCTATSGADLHTILCEQPTTVGGLNALFPTVHAQTATAAPLHAALDLRSVDLHPVRLALTLRRGSVDRMVVIEEETLDHIPALDAPAGIFAPIDGRPSTASMVPSISGPLREATASLEMRLVEVVDRFPASEYLSIERSGTHALAVMGLVQDAEGKRALLDAIASLDAAGAVAAEIATFAEVTQAQRARGDATRLEIYDAPVGPAPIEPYLRTRVPTETDTSALARELGADVVREARRARRHAVVLERLLERFPEDVLAALDTQGRAAWRVLARRHLAEGVGALHAVDAALAPYFDAGVASALSTPVGVTLSIRRFARETLIVEQIVTGAFSAADPALESTSVITVLDVRQHVQEALAAARSVEALIPR